MLRILGKAKPTDKTGTSNDRDWNANRKAGLPYLELYVKDPSDLESILSNNIPEEFKPLQAEIERELVIGFVDKGRRLSELGIEYISTHVSRDFKSLLEKSPSLFDVQIGFESLPATNLQRIKEGAGTTPEELIDYVSFSKEQGIDAFINADINHLAQTELVRLGVRGLSLLGKTSQIYEEHKRFTQDDSYLGRIKKKCGRNLNQEIDRTMSTKCWDSISYLFFTKVDEYCKVTKMPKLLEPAFKSSINLMKEHIGGYSSICDHRMVTRVGEPTYDEKWSYCFPFMYEKNERIETANLFETHLHLGCGDFAYLIESQIETTTPYVKGFVIETNDKTPTLLKQDKDFIAKIIHQKS